MPGLRIWIIASVLLTAGTIPAGAVSSPPDSAGVDRQQRIEELTRLAKKPGATDSLRYELALARAAAGTIEDRYQALRLLDGIKRSYGKEARYHRDVARIFIDAQQPSRAIQSLEEVVRIEPEDVKSRVEIGRLILRDLLYHYDLRNTGRMVTWLRSALDRDPGNRDALFLASLALEMATGLPDAAPDLSVQGRAYADSILARDPADTAARLLLAIHELNLGEVETARTTFDAALRTGPPELRNVYQSMKWTASEKALDRAEKIETEKKDVFQQAYWLYQDPTPLSRINENQLEIWKRLALAEFLFGQPDKGVRGWDVPAGEAYVRYGPPKAHDFDPGEIKGSEGARDKSAIKLIPPAWTWTYAFRDLDFNLRFQDDMLNGNFHLDNPSAVKMTLLRKNVPVIYNEATPGPIHYLYMASAGVAGEGRRTRQSIHLAVPFWRPSERLDWLPKVFLEIDVENLTRTFGRRSQRRAAAKDVFSMVDSMNVLVATSEFSLEPGKYRVTAYVRDDDRKVHGMFTMPIEVRDYAAPAGLEISDLELSFSRDPGAPGPSVTTLGETHLPNAMGVVGDARNLEIFYELYGLSPRNGGANHQARYTIVPREFLLDYEELVEAGKARSEDLVKFAASEGSLNGLTLTTENYQDVVFPPATLAAVEGRGSKATRLPLGALEPGEYAFIATVRSPDSGAEASAQTFFRILTDAQIRDLLAFSRGGK